MWRAFRGIVYCVTLAMMMSLGATVAGANSNAETFMNLPDSEMKSGDLSEGESREFGSPYVVSSAEWRSDGDSMEGYYYYFNRGGWRSNGGTVCMMAPVFLKTGVTIFEYWVTITDDDAAQNVTIYLKRVDNYDGVVETVASVVSSGDIGLQNLFKFDLAHVVSQDHSYYLTTCSSSTNILVHQARIWYTE